MARLRKRRAVAMSAWMNGAARTSACASGAAAEPTAHAARMPTNAARSAGRAISRVSARVDAAATSAGLHPRHMKKIARARPPSAAMSAAARE